MTIYQPNAVLIIMGDSVLTCFITEDLAQYSSSCDDLFSLLWYHDKWLHVLSLIYL